MADLKPNYFVCTLGQAAEAGLCQDKRYTTVIDFLDHQARALPDLPAVAFPAPSLSDPWGTTLYTFAHLRRSAIATGTRLANVSSEEATTRRTVALLCPSSIEFLLAWLGLITRGCAVLLLAPQCQPAAIAHLCKTCEVTTLFYDETYKTLADKAATETERDFGLQTVCLPNTLSSVECREESDDQGLFQEPVKVDAYDVAYLHHTSGTSTGVPKPIPQSHRAAVGVLPAFADGKENASFTTTPLYHGGVADCFRAWTSGALIWLFPGKHVPITALNVLKSLDAAATCREIEHVAAVKYFSSVPFVLQMLASENRGLDSLRSMEIVGVGGAALTQDVGDDLVAKGINLVSRFGSAECGFLMSSHRDYAADNQWSYLRSHGSPLLDFSHPHNDRLKELIVRQDWPHMAKRNTENGSYATADLFQAHEAIPDAWKYHSRADSQLTLVTGKKFDPSPLEDALAASPLLKDVFIFGNGQQYPGVLLFRPPSTSSISEKDLLRDLWPLLEKLNAQSQDHARIDRSMLIIMPHDAPKLPKSSKGTVLRGEAERIFAGVIKGAYEDDLAVSGGHGTEEMQVPPDHEVASRVLEIIKQVIVRSDPIPADADLFTYGVDSVACMHIRGIFQSKIVGRKIPALPINVVYDNGNINRLADFLMKFRKGQTLEAEDEIQLMYQLAEEYSDLGSPSYINPADDIIKAPKKSGETIILTGATGSLGVHILSQVLDLRTTTRVVCLVRGASKSASQARVTKSLSQRQLNHDVDALTSSRRLECLPCNLSSPDLGLDCTTYQDLARNATMIIHAAWSVNFNTRLRSFIKDHIAGLRHLLAFTASCTKIPQFLFCSSTASITSSLSPSCIPIPETISTDPHTASPLGYSRSKWVAESICTNVANAQACHGNHDLRSRNRINIVRIGQLCGDMKHGIWNMSEAWPLMLSTSSPYVTGGIPDLGDAETLEWLPVDKAATAVLKIAHQQQTKRNEGTDLEGAKVFHVLNPDVSVTWRDLLAWVKELRSEVYVYAPQEWLRRLEEVKDDHPAKKLIGLWKGAFQTGESGQDGAGSDDGKLGERAPRFQIKQTKAVLGDDGLAIDEPMSKKLFEKLYTWITKEMIE